MLGRQRSAEAEQEENTGSHRDPDRNQLNRMAQRNRPSGMDVSEVVDVRNSNSNAHSSHPQRGRTGHG